MIFRNLKCKKNVKKKCLVDHLVGSDFPAQKIFFCQKMQQWKYFWIRIEFFPSNHLKTFAAFETHSNAGRAFRKREIASSCLPSRSVSNRCRSKYTRPKPKLVGCNSRSPSLAKSSNRRSRFPPYSSSSPTQWPEIVLASSWSWTIREINAMDAGICFERSAPQSLHNLIVNDDDTDATLGRRISAGHAESEHFMANLSAS